MSFYRLAEQISEDPAIVKLVGRAAKSLAVAEPARAAAVAGVTVSAGRKPVVVVVPTSAEVDRLVNDLKAFLGEDEVVAFPAWETLPFERVSPSIETMGARCEVMWRLQNSGSTPKVVVASIKSLLQKLAPDLENIKPIAIAEGDQVDSADLVKRLVEFGYRRESQVEHRGEIAVRGSIVDVFASTADRPLRIDLWGDEVDRLNEFSVGDQRSKLKVASVNIFPARELTATAEVAEIATTLQASEPWGREHWQRLADGELFDGMESWLPWLVTEDKLLTDYLSADSLVVLVEPSRLRSRGQDVVAEEKDLAKSLAKTWGALETVEDASVEFPMLHSSVNSLLNDIEGHVLSFTNVPDSPDVAVMSAAGWGSPGEAMALRISKLLEDKSTLVVAAEGEGSASRCLGLLSSWGHNMSGEVVDVDSGFGVGAQVVVQHLERGFILADVGIAVLTENDLSGRRTAHKKLRRSSRRESGGYFDDLKPGDLVVHHQHGLGRFAGMVTRAIGGFDRDYLLLEYKGDDKLYLPSDQIELIRRYSGGDTPRLNRLGGADFAKAKAKVRSAVNEIAQELVVLYQKRVSTKGHIYEPDSPWQQEVEAAFPYTLTPDQAEAVIAIKDDMESPTPMDRLLVGDVGFGKTEVALRAAFKATQSNKQVAILVPTTLLAQQHFQTFSDRFAPYPLRVEVLSRFLTNAQAKKVLAGVESGEVDVLIGTHRLLSKDLKFKDLGLLVVDEEQRFGVSHKEAIKSLKTNVDVLTLTATPIPRTLEMSLTGIRDLSLLNTPPADRQPILTYVGEYDESPVAEAIRRELLREGQVFYVHNRVRSIEKVAQELRNLVPEARIAVAHGQMDEGTLEKVVLDFWEGEYDVLVCTTIIESGIDMPTVNTLVVDRAELLGLGQLHQLRGRVGRSGQRAYAYLFTRPDASLTEEAYERLRTIGESTELGSGFKIAMRDLEIRGAGNLLGTGQSGHIAAVGYDLYCQMVTEAVAELKGESPVEENVEVQIDIPVDAHLPVQYIEGERQRIEAYRQLSEAIDDASVEEVASSWLDRFGPIPLEAQKLLEISKLKAACVRLGINEITVVPGPGFGGPEFVARMEPVKLKVSQEVRFRRLYPSGVWKPSEDEESGGQLQIDLKKKDLLVELSRFFTEMFDTEV